MNSKFFVDARFYARSGPYNLTEVAAVFNGIAAKSDHVLSGVAPLQTAGSNEVSFLDNSRYASLLEKTGAGAVIVHPDMVNRVPPSATPIITTAPYDGWARVAALFHPLAPASPGIHPTAFVASNALVDPTAEIGAFACIEGRAQIGPSTTAVDIAKQEVRIRVAGSGTAGRGTGACAAMPTRTTRSR